MFILLFTILCILTIFTYRVYGKDLLSPSIWLLYGYDLSVAIAITKMQTWGDISFFTMKVILLGIFAFLIGGFIGNKVANKGISEKKIYGNMRLKFNIRTLFIFLVILIIITLADFYFIRRAATMNGFSGGNNFLTFARGDKSIPTTIYYAVIVAQIIAYAISHDIITRLINNEKCHLIKAMLSWMCVGVFLVITVLSTGRTMLMHYVLFLLADVTIQLKFINNWSIAQNKKIIKYGLIALLVILLFFAFVEEFLRASQYGTQRVLLDQIAKYTSSSFYALDNYLHNITYASNGNYETLYNIQSILKKIGFSFDVGSGNNTLPFTSFASYNTNVYTALRRYIHDYGYGGMVVIQFLIGFFYQRTYRKIKSGKATLLMFIMYCTFIFAPVFNCIEERVLINVLSLRSALVLVGTSCIIKVYGRFKYSNRMR